jgi:hypothetical protein
MRKGFWAALLFAFAVAPSTGRPDEAHRPPVPLQIGWHDEMNEPRLWSPIGPENPPDVYAERLGVLTLRLPHVPQGYPYAYQWSGVTRSISADLAHFPVLMARVGGMEDGSYAHLDIEERDFKGHAVRTWRSPTLTRPGLTTIDLGKEIGPTVRRLKLRLIVGGKLAGAKCDYNWVRFVRREDVARLNEAPDLQAVTSREPAEDVQVPAAGGDTTRAAATAPRPR